MSGSLAQRHVFGAEPHAGTGRCGRLQVVVRADRSRARSGRSASCRGRGSLSGGLRPKPLDEALRRTRESWMPGWGRGKIEPVVRNPATAAGTLTVDEAREKPTENAAKTVLSTDQARQSDRGRTRRAASQKSLPCTTPKTMRVAFDGQLLDAIIGCFLREAARAKLSSQSRGCAR